MEEYEEDEEFYDSETVNSISINEDEDEEDPKGDAFMRGVEEAVEIKDIDSEVEDEEF